MRDAGKLFLAAAVLLAGCASETFLAEDAPEFLVRRAQAPVYRLGPQQAAPPEERLAKNERVRLLRREFGYSLALLADGQTGYIANEDIEPAPPPVVTAVVERESPGPARSADVNLPPVEPPLPKPDLDVSPADAPAP